jgi:prolyl-tRNA synthetase
VFPAPIAPYYAHLIGLNLTQPEVAQAADELYEQLWSMGVETLYDDRPDQAPGVKFNDADLLGMPVRIVVSPRNLTNGVVELKARTADDAERVPAEEAAETVAQRLRDLG